MNNSSSNHIQQEDVDALFHDTFLSSAKWGKQLTGLSQLCCKEDSREALQDLVWHTSSLISLRRRSTDLIDITDEEKSKIISFFSSKLVFDEMQKLDTSMMNSTQSKIYLLLLKNISTIEKNPVLTRALQSQNFSEYRTYQGTLSTESTQSIEDEIHDYCLKVKFRGTLRSNLILIKSLLSIVESDPSNISHLQAQSFNFGNLFFVPGPDDLKSILGQITEAERLTTFHSSPRFVPTHGSVDKIKPLEFLGPVSGFISGYFAPVNESAVYYYEGIVKGSQPMRIGWEVVPIHSSTSSQTSFLSPSPIDSTQSSPFPGDTELSWAFDGCVGAFYHNASNIKESRKSMMLDVGEIESKEETILKTPIQKTDVDTPAKIEVEKVVNEVDELASDPRFLPFIKLLRIGIPPQAVEQRMSQSGLSDQDIQKLLRTITHRKIDDNDDQQLQQQQHDPFDFGDLFNEPSSNAATGLSQKQSVAEGAYFSGGNLLALVDGQITLCSEPIDFGERQYNSWKVGDVVGCLLDTKLNVINFYLNGIKQGQFNLPVLGEGYIFRPIASGATGAGFQLRLPSVDKYPDLVKKIISDRQPQQVNDKVNNDLTTHTNNYYDSIPSRFSCDRQRSICLKLNDPKFNDVGYILGNSKVLEKVSSTHSFCLEISARLDDFPLDTVQTFTLFSFTGKNSGYVNRVLVNHTGAIVCDMFGRQYRSHDNAVKPRKWHHISIVYSTSRSSVACVIDKTVHAMTKQVEDPIDTTVARKFESAFCIGAELQFELISPSEPEKITPATATATSTTAATGDGGDEVPPLILDQSQESQSEIKETSSIAIPTEKTENWRLTKVHSGWVGGICDVRLWTASRSMQDITESSARHVLSGSEKRLCSYWRLDEGIGRVAHDSAQLDGTWSPAHAMIYGNCNWYLFDPLNDLPTNPLDVETESESNKEPNVLFRNILTSQPHNEFSIQDGLMTLSQKLYNSCTNLLGWKIGKGPKVLPTSKYYEIQLRSPGYKAICEPHVLTFLFLNSCFKQLLRLLVLYPNSSPSSLNQLSALAISLTLLRILHVNISVIKEKKLSVSSLGLKYANRNTENSSLPFVATLLNSVLGFLSYSDLLESDSTEIRDLKLLIRKESILVIMTGFSIFFPHVADQALLLQCLLIQKHSSNPTFPWNSFSLEMKTILDCHRDSSINLTSLPSDPLILLQSLSQSCLNEILASVCDWMATTTGEDDFVLKFLPRGSIPINRSQISSTSNKIQQEGVIQVGDIVQRGKDWSYGNEDGGPNSRGVVVHIFSWLNLFPSCGITVRWPNGIKNSYCYGCRYTNLGSADLRYDLEIAKSAATNNNNNNNNNTHQVDEDERLSLNGLIRQREIKRELLYTPDDVRQSLVEEVGNLTKRVVLRYMKSIAPMEWQISRKLSWTENSLVSKLSGEEVSKLYAEFYQTFSLNPKSMGSASTFAYTNTLTLDEPEGFVAIRYTSIMEMLLFDIESSHCSGGSSTTNLITTPTYILVSVIQSYLTGQYEYTDTGGGGGGGGGVESKSISELEVCIKPLENRLLKFTPLKSTTTSTTDTSSNQFLLWNWELGTWSYSKELGGGEKNSTIEANPVIQARYINVSFDASKLGKNLSMSEDGHALIQKSSRKWSTCIGMSPLKPKSGVYKWCVKIESLGRRGHCIFGVATEDVSINTYLGQDSSGWGLTMNNEIYHSSRSQQPEKTLKLSTNSILEMVYDSNENILHFTDTTTPAAGTITTKITSGDKTLYPAFSLFSPGDHIVFLSLSEATRMLEAPSSQQKKTTTSLEKSNIPGYPSPSLLNYMKMLSTSLLNILNRSNEECILEMLGSPLVGASFPQLIACLARWEYISHSHISDQDGLTSCLHNILNYFHSEKFLQISKTLFLNDPTFNTKLLMDGVSQLCTLILSYLGRVASSFIYRDRPVLDNHDVAMEYQLLQSTISQERVIPNETEMFSSKGLLEWLKSSLFSNGLKDQLGSNCPTTIAELFTYCQSKDGIIRPRNDDLLWEWVTKHDKLSHKIKTIGGSNLSLAIQIVLNVLLYHHGYIEALTLLVDHLDTLRESPNLLHDFFIREPPAFLMQIISVVGKIRFWAMQSHQTQGFTYEQIGSRLASRAKFLFDLMPLKSSQPFLVGYIREFCSGEPESLSLFLESQGLLNLEADSRLVSDLIVSFLKDNVSLILLRVGLKTATTRAIERREGFSLLNVALSSAVHFPGWLHKVALLSHLPLVMRGDSSCLLFPNSPLFIRSASDFSNGYYMNGLETCNQLQKSSVRGAFYSLYSSLTSELSSARSNGDIPLILLILNCWGLLIDAEDHDMLARVKIFHVIHEILEINTTSPISTSASESGSGSGSGSGSDDSGCNYNTVTRAAMKVFYLLALQIASTPETKKSLESDTYLSSPVLVRTRSGPSTLSEVVFDMLYNQFQLVLSSLRGQWNENSKDDQPLMVQLSEDNIIILNESTLLLTCVSKDPTCQKILSHPTWLSLLLELCIFCPVLCKQRSLRILSDLLPVISPNVFDTLDESLLSGYFDEVYEEGVSISVWYIGRLLDFAGKLLQMSPQYSVFSGTEKITDLSNSASSEVTSEVVALIRILLSTPRWQHIIEDILQSCILLIKSPDAAASNPKNSIKIIAALAVLGGHVESFYPGSIVEILPTKSESPKLGVIVSSNMSSDLLEIVIITDSNGNSAVTPGELRNTKYASQATHNRRTILLSQERIRAINRCPISETSLSHSLIEVLLKTILSINITVNSKIATPNCSGEVFSDQFLSRYLNFLGCRAISALATTERSATIIHQILTSTLNSNDNNFSNSLLSLFKLGATITTTAGLPDIYLLETHLTILINQRNQCVRQKKIEDSKIKETKLEDTPLPSSDLPIQPNESQCASASASAGAGASDTTIIGADATTNIDASASVGTGAGATSGIASGIAGASASAGVAEIESSSSDPLRPSSSPLSIEDESKEDNWQKQSDYLDLGGGILAQDPNPELISLRNNQKIPREEGEPSSHHIVENSMFESDWNLHAEDSQPYDEEGFDDGHGLMVDQLEQMGFPRRWCELALTLCGSDLGEALNYILANGDSLDSMTSHESKKDNEDGGDGGGGGGGGVGEDEDEDHIDIGDIRRNIIPREQNESSRKEFHPSEEQSSYPFANISEPASLSMPKDYHYSEKRNILLPIYSQPDLTSERIGTLFPGDDIVAIEEIFTKSYEDGIFPQWVKVYFADYQEEPCEENEDDEYLFPEDRYKQHEYAWIPTSDDGVKVVLPGPTNPSEGLLPLADPPSKTFPVQYKIRINNPRGLVVRESIRRSSDPVGTLLEGTIARVIEETFDVEGGQCWRIVDPYHGWILKKHGRCEIIEVLSHNHPSQMNENQDSKIETTKKDNPSEWELYDQIEDGMEQWVGSDVYRKDDRFFGSFQGMEFKVYNDRSVDQDDEGTAHNRRCRILETGSIPGAIKAISALSMETIEQKILLSIQTLMILHARHSCLGILLRDTKNKDSNLLQLLLNSLLLEGEEKSELLDSPSSIKPSTFITFKTPCESEIIGVTNTPQPSSISSLKALSIAEIFLSFLRLVLFRGEPYSLSLGLENLALDDLEAIGLQKGLLSLENIMGTMFLNFMSQCSHSESTLSNSFSLYLSEGFLISIVKQIRLACSNNYSEHSWSDPNYFDDTDSDCMKHPNLHFAIFSTEILMKLNDSNISLLCNAWCRALRSPCMSIKYFAFHQLSAILSYLIENRRNEENNDELLSNCLKLIPISRLKAMCARRLWHEMEDQPAYSRYLCEMIHFLSILKTSTELLSNEQALCNESISQKSMSSDPCACSRNVVEFDSNQKSSIQLTPYKEMKHSWTVETWIFVTRVNEVILPVLAESNDTQPASAITTTNSGASAMGPASASGSGSASAITSTTTTTTSPCTTIPMTQKTQIPAKKSENKDLPPELPTLVSSSRFAEFSAPLEESRPQTARLHESRPSNLFSSVRSTAPTLAPPQPMVESESGSLEYIPRLVRESSSSNFGGADSLLSQWNQGRPSPFSGFGRSAMNNGNSHPDWAPTHDWGDVPPHGEFNLSGVPLSDSDSMHLPEFDAPVFMRSSGMSGSDSRRAGRGGGRESGRESGRENGSGSGSGFWRSKPEGSGSGIGSGSGSRGFGESRNTLDQDEPSTMKISQPPTPSKVGSVEPSYLLASSTSYIKLQAGGPVSETVEDPEQQIDPVAERALCLAIGQLGDTEKVFDYVIPVGKWVHLAISCERSSETVNLYVNGELQSLVRGRFVLPQSTLGHCALGKSFTGQLAELRIWSNSRSSEEVRRDMFTNVSECRSLVSLLTFGEGEGNFTVDGVGLSSCRLKNCDWKRVIAPSTQNFLCPKFMLKETEEAEGVFGEGIGESHRVHELTGIIKLTGNIPHHLRTSIDQDGQSVCVCYRFLENSSTEIEGYVEWCELNVRCQIRGILNNETNELEFKMITDQCAVILGPPEELSWCLELSFRGHIEDSRLVGDIEVKTISSLSPPLLPGEIRIDETLLPQGISFSQDKAKKLEVVAVGEGEKSNSYFILVEIFPRVLSTKSPPSIPRYPSSSPDNFHNFKVEWDNFLFPEILQSKDDGEDESKDEGETWKDVLSAHDYDSPIPSPNYQNYRSMSSIDFNTTMTSLDTFGICNHHESMWIDWSALTTSETVLYGLCTYDVAKSKPNYNYFLENNGCWTYSSKGKVSHGSITDTVDAIQKGDKISIEVDPFRGRVGFYRNDVLVYEFHDLHNQSSMECPIEGNKSKYGLLPFVFLGSSSDSTSLHVVSTSDIEKSQCRTLKYGINDSFGRHTFNCNTLDGSASGKGVLTYHHGNGFWCGNWFRNNQHGVQLWVSPPRNGSDDSKYEIQPYLYENNIVIRELTQEEAKPWIDEWTKELQRALYRFELKEKKFKFSDLPKYITSEFLTSSGVSESTITDNPVDRSLLTVPKYVLKIVYQNGATVRAGIDIDQSRPIRSLNYGDVVDAYKRAVTHDGIPRYQISDGWISGKLRGGAGDPVVQVLEYRPTTPLKYRVIREDGAKIRQGCDLDSPEVVVCPYGTIIEVSEKKLQEGPNDSQPTTRLKIISPLEYVGWASEKINIVKLISEDENAHDASIKDEMKRRMDVRQQRVEIKNLNILTRLPMDLFPKKPKITIQGTINVSEECFFLLNKSQCNSGLKISPDFLSVTCEGRSSGRPMVLGTRGFSKGIHYWEVQVDSAQWGSVFIGVAPLDSSNWTGYGFINYRATQNSGSETLYGSYYSAGDTVGILLDMDHGTISFFKDGEDFNVGRTVVINMGVAYHSLRRNHKSSHPALYPCFGMKSSGDQLSIRRCKWASQRGVGPISILERVLDAKNILKLWGHNNPSLNEISTTTTTTAPQFSPNLISKIYDAYLRWRQHDLVVITSRSGIDVAIDTRIDAILRAAQPTLDLCPSIRAGIKVRTPYGPGKIVGARLDELWYILDSEENGAWYWTSDQLIDLISLGSISFDDENLTTQDEPKDEQIEIPMMSKEEFTLNLISSTKTWSPLDDDALIQLVNSYSNKHDCDPLRIVAVDLENYRKQNGILPDRSVEEIQVRYSVVCVLNRSAQFTLPFLDFGRSMGSLLITQYDKVILNKFPVYQFQPHLSSSGQVYLNSKRLIFTKTKLKLWKLAVTETTIFTTPPPDEYERPDEIPEITLNRMEAQMAKQIRESLPFSECFTKSLFGQLFSAIADWDETSLRRSFVHMQDAGQARAFYVKFTGEGVDDHGGPYRAVFETSIGEEAESFLELFTPCSNAKIRTGENRDQSVFNSTYLREVQKHPYYIHFGKLMAIANRHDILVSLSLPQLIWKPLVGESLQLSDLRATDLHLLTSLQTIARNDMPSEEMSDMLMQLLLSCSLPQHIVTRIGSVSGLEERSNERIQEICSLINQLNLISHKSGLSLLHKGMSSVLPTELFSLFTSNELETLFCGEPDVDISLLQKVTEYEGVSPTDRHIIQFWEALYMMSSAELSQFINFCSGRARLPSSAADFPMNFKLTAPPPLSIDKPDLYLPIAQTCFFSLSLPQYSSKIICLEKLKYAISNAHLMDADFMMRNAVGWENIR